MNISVVIPVFNAFDSLQPLLLRLLSDTLQGDEIVVVNDGSEDYSWDYYENLADLDKRIRVFSRPHLGIVSALNFGVQSAKNELIARMDVDDHFISGRFSTQRSLFDDDPKLVLAFTDYRIFSASEAYLGYIACGVTDYAVKLSLINPSRTAHSSAMFRRNAYFKGLGYRQDDYPAEDLGLWQRLIPLGNFTGVPVSFLNYVISPYGISSSRKREMRLKSQSLRIQISKVLFIDKSAIRNSMEVYKGISNGTERAMLFARDLFTLMVLQRRISMTSLIVILQTFMKLKAIRAIIRLVIWRVKRRYYRNHLNN